MFALVNAVLDRGRSLRKNVDTFLGLPFCAVERASFDFSFGGGQPEAKSFEILPSLLFDGQFVFANFNWRSWLIFGGRGKVGRNVRFNELRHATLEFTSSRKRSKQLRVYATARYASASCSSRNWTARAPQALGASCSSSLENWPPVRVIAERDVSESDQYPALKSQTEHAGTKEQGWALVPSHHEAPLVPWLRTKVERASRRGNYGEASMAFSQSLDQSVEEQRLELLHLHTTDIPNCVLHSAASIHLSRTARPSARARCAELVRTFVDRLNGQGRDGRGHWSDLACKGAGGNTTLAACDMDRIV